VDAAASGEVDALVAGVAGDATPGDVVLVMSNGAFGGFIEKLRAALTRR
jgi:UDP-N-acetylmuramate: L-alanyl-gamma-D-glutamyl-meso-diaminopimelate ligase